MTSKQLTTAKSATVAPATRSALVALAERLGVDAGDVFIRSLRSVAFKAPDVTDEQLMALVLVSNAYRLNPFTKEIYAFPDKGGGIVPIVSVDGWYRILNEHPQFDGLEYVEGIDDTLGRFGECTIYRKDRQHPLRLREYLNECKRNTDAWRGNPSRMMRHRAIIQTARVAFGFAGIYDQDEAERILEAQRMHAPAKPIDAKGAERLALALAAQPEPEPLGPPLMQENVVSVPQPLGELASPALLGDDDEARALAADAQRMIADDELPI